MREHAQEERRRNIQQRVNEINAKLTRIREKEGRARNRYESGVPPHKKQVLACVFLVIDCLTHIAENRR